MKTLAALLLGAALGAPISTLVIDPAPGLVPTPDPSGRDAGPEQDPEPGQDPDNVDAKGRTFQGWAQREERSCARLIYFHKTVDPKRPWHSSPGEVALEHGLPPWKDGALAAFEKYPFPRWRMGMNHWTNLDTSFPLKLGGADVPAGYYYVALHRGDDGAWSLALYDPRACAEQELDAWHANRREMPRPVALAPLAHEKVAETADQLGAQFELTDESDHRKAKLVIRYGPHRLTADVVAVF